MGGITQTSNASTLAVAQSTTSGTFFDFTGIPSWVKKISMMFNGVSTNGVSSPLLQIGSGSIDVTGYLGGAGYIGSSTGIGNDSNGFLLTEPSSSGGAAVTRHGTVVLTNMGNNIWTLSGAIGRSDSPYLSVCGGSKSLSGVLDRVRLTTFNGTDAFDAGSVNILYE